MARLERNYGKNGIEIYFDAMPSEDIRRILKENAWQWSRNRQCWYKKYSLEDMEFAERICDEGKREKVFSKSENVHIDIENNRDKTRENILDKTELAISNKMENLTEDSKNNSQLTYTIPENASGIFADHPACLYDRNKLRSLFSDIFLGNKLLTNIYLSAFDIGVINRINSAKELDNGLCSRLIKQMMNDSGLTEENATLAIHFWLDEYGTKYLGKEKKYSNNKNPKKTSQNDRNNSKQNKIEEKKITKERTKRKSGTIHADDELVDVQDLQIVYKGIVDTSRAGIPDIELAFYVKNSKSDYIEFYLRDFIVNGYNVRADCSPTIKVKSKTQIINNDYNLDSDDLKMLGIKDANDIRNIKATIGYNYHDITNPSRAWQFKKLNLYPDVFIP